jgi:hypothetical protein
LATLVAPENTEIKRFVYVLRLNESSCVAHADDIFGTCMLAFESINHALNVLNEYVSATKCTADIQLYDILGLDENINVRLYKMNGRCEDITNKKYMRLLALQENNGCK